MNTYKTHYDQYRMVQATYIDKSEVISDLNQLWDHFKRVTIPLLQMIKADMLARSIKIMDKIDYIYYINGASASMEILQRYIEWSFTESNIENVSLLTRKPLK